MITLIFVIHSDAEHKYTNDGSIPALGHVHENKLPKTTLTVSGRITMVQ